MRLAWINRFDDATLSPGSEIASLPATNAQHAHLSKKWHTATGVKSSHVVADLGAQYPIDVLAVVGTNLTPTATLRLRASNSDATGATGEIYDSTLIGAGVIADYPAIYHDLDGAQTARYWRIDLADAAVADHLQVGRIFLGPAWSVDRELGWDISWLDGSQVEQARGGQSWIDEGPRRRLLRFHINSTTRAEMLDNAFEIARRNGLAEQVLALIDDSDAYVPHLSMLGYVQEMTPIVQENARIYRQRYHLEEAL
jgi:hypothetical protein